MVKKGHTYLNKPAAEYFRKRLKWIFHVINSEPAVTQRCKVMMKLLSCLDLDYFELFLCTVFRNKCYSETEVNFWQWLCSQFIVTRYDDVLMCFDLSYFHALFLEVMFSKVKYIFNSINSEPIVILGYNVMMTSSKCLHLDYFVLFLCTLLEVSIVIRDWKRFLT